MAQLETAAWSRSGWLGCCWTCCSRPSTLRGSVFSSCLCLLSLGCLCCLSRSEAPLLLRMTTRLLLRFHLTLYFQFISLGQDPCLNAIRNLKQANLPCSEVICVRKRADIWVDLQDMLVVWVSDLKVWNAFSVHLAVFFSLVGLVLSEDADSMAWLLNYWDVCQDSRLKLTLLLSICSFFNVLDFEPRVI